MEKNYYFGDKMCYFNKPFYDQDSPAKWNQTISNYIVKINDSVDDRAFVIFASGLLEKQITQILLLVYPNYKVLADSESITFSLKIKILKATNLIPNQFLNFSELVRDIRNSFAHNIEVENFNDFMKDKKLRKKLEKINSYCNEWKDSLVKSNINSSWRIKFDDIYRLALEGLFCYENNVKVLFDKIWSNDFRKELNENNFNG